MSVAKLIHHFEGAGKVPVDIKDVVTETRSLFGTSLTIKVRGVDVDVGRLKGNCYRYQIDDSTILVPRQVALIVYSKRMHLFEQRLVCCKELVHLADPDPIMTSKKEQVLYLAEELIKPHKEVNGDMPVKDLQVFLDLLAKWHALAILFPFGLREELIKRADTLDYDRLAEAVELPKEYIRVIMHPEWESVRATILAYC